MALPVEIVDSIIAVAGAVVGWLLKLLHSVLSEKK